MKTHLGSEPENLASLGDSMRIPPRVGSTTEIAKLEAEVQFLKRQLNLAKRERWEKLSVKDTIKRIILGEVSGNICV